VAVAPEAEPVTIAEMHLAHVPAVLEIERRSFLTPWSERAFVSELAQNAYAHYIVALRGSRVLGYGGMWLVMDEAHVTNIAVHPAERRQGLGDRLLTALEERAAARGCRRMTLEVRPSNDAARRLYRKHGFVAQGIRPGYYADTREDAIVMCKEDLRGPAPPPGPRPAGASGQ
jgi:ribosomal-protein-alanine N-acetyltransferase